MYGVDHKAQTRDVASAIPYEKISFGSLVKMHSVLTYTALYFKMNNDNTALCEQSCKGEYHD